MNKDEQLNTLFSDNQTTEFGCVMFDIQEVDNKSIPVPGSGWASIDGKSAFRIKSIADLSKKIRWLTNLSQEVFWKTGVVKHNHLKASNYLRSDVSQIAKELGLIVPLTPIANICEVISELFSKVMKMSEEFYNIKDFNAKTLSQELKANLIVPDKNISVPVDEALSRAYQDLVICDHVLPKNEQLFISLKRPRYFHAKSILETTVPIIDEDWSFISAEELPIHIDKKLDYLMNLNKPFVAKIKINSFENTDNLYVDLTKLLNLGEALGDGGRTKERNWVCQPELLYLSKFSNLDIEAVFVAKGYQEIENNINLPYLGELSDFSLSLGILSECLWNGLASRSTNPQTRGNTLVSPRACWLKACDRFMTFTSAMMLSSAGFIVTSYGYGAVNIALDYDKLDHLIDIAPHAGLSIPLNLLNKRTAFLT